MEQRQGAIDMMMVLQYLLEDIGTNLDPTCRFSRNTSIIDGRGKQCRLSSGLHDH